MATTKPASNGRFAEFVGRQPSDIDELPLIHSTRCERVLEIAKTSRLEPHDCPVFREPLVYFFYGRPAYQSRCGKRPTTDIMFFPVCFVFKPYLHWPKIQGIFPFDSRAAKEGKFRRHIPPAAFRHYELKSCIDSAKRIVRHFFETNDAYYITTAKRGVVFPPAEQEAQRYYALITTKGETSDDDRRATIEVRMRDGIILKDRLQAVVLPTSFLQNSEIRKAVYQVWQVYPIRYDTYEGAIPSAFKTVIFSKLKDHLANGGYL